MREGCEKVFHAHTEAVVALVQKKGFPEPGSHAERRRALDKLGERKLAKIGDEASLYFILMLIMEAGFFPRLINA